ncbi:class I SAM-dependent methyltransferase [Salsuginibacillus kocurii]|uniref:class I SAM-dependent methyltransferase n=1 Tax=Salsuginibacillus kocurii TaxID=427078 RepID=UPI000382D5D7|nr:class I SAM-dependent methyltransferase [Salsuginibacillus kocurii]
MMNEWRRLIWARKWMKKNETFLPTWHAHLGYSLYLFEAFRKPVTIDEVVKERNLNHLLLQRWVEVGLAVGHLKAKRNGKIKSDKHMLRYVAPTSPDSVGILLKEMLELHMPTMLAYKELLVEDEKVSYVDKDHGKTVAETSALLETLAFPKILSEIKRYRCKKIMDLGCGHGGYLARLAQKKPKHSLFGVEMHADVLKEAQKRTEGYENVKLLHEKIEDLHPTNYNPDMVMLNNVLYYFPAEERLPIFKKAYDLLDAKGVLVVMSPINGVKNGNAFSSAFNSFMSAQDNLYPLPSFKSIKEYGKLAGFRMKRSAPIIKEGGWYYFVLQKK